MTINWNFFAETILPNTVYYLTPITILSGACIGLGISPHELLSIFSRLPVLDPTVQAATYGIATINTALNLYNYSLDYIRQE
jgi:hypothetical protein